MASSKVFTLTLSDAKNVLYWSKSFLFLLITPLLSSIKMFSFFTPTAMYILAQEFADAPAPLITNLTSPIFLPEISTAFNKPADEIIAVPC